MVKPNSEVWQWESGHTAQKAGTVFGDGSVVTFRAEDDIKKYDVVALYGTGSTENYSAAQLPAQMPSVCACGNATDGFKQFGVALKDASSGNTVSVRIKGVITCKTNTAITAGDWVRGSLGGSNEKQGTCHKVSNTGDPILGLALNTTEAPASAGTGTSASPFNYRAVHVLLMQMGDNLNR